MEEPEFDKWWKSTFTDTPSWLHRSCYGHGFERATDMYAKRAGWLAFASFVIGAVVGNLIGF